MLSSLGTAISAVDVNTSSMPNSINILSSILLINYLNTTNRDWFNKQLEDHQATIKQFADFLVSEGVRFVLVEINGDLTHRRFDALPVFF